MCCQFTRHMGVTGRTLDEKMDFYAALNKVLTEVRE